MIYDFAITIPAGTPQTQPVITSLQLDKGIIHKLEVEFPPGCGSEVAVWIRDGSHQVYPSNPDGQFASDGYCISFEDYLELNTPDYSLEAYCSSPNATYDHTVRIRVGVIGNDAASFILKVAQGLQKLLAAFRINI